MSPDLIVTNVSYIFLAILTLAVGFFVLYRGSRKLPTVSFSLYCFVIVIYEISYLGGINTLDSATSRSLFMFGLVSLFVPLLTVQWVFTILGKLKKHLAALGFFYLFSLALAAFYILNPLSYLKDSLPKLYFPNYYNPGEYHYIWLIFFVLSSLYSLVAILFSYREAEIYTKSRLNYLFVGVLLAYIFLASPVLLSYDIAFDPLWSLITGLFFIPLAYSILKFDLMDIHVAAKRALLYGVAIAMSGVFIVLINSVNTAIVSSIPGFPNWIIPFLSGAVAVSIGVFVWERIKEVDKLKYEFITVLTHKLRTPLTYIKWSIDNLRSAQIGEGARHDISVIENANIRLLELTNRLIGLGGTEGDAYRYNLKEQDLSALVKEVLEAYQKQLNEKSVKVESDVLDSVSLAFVDAERMKFVFQILLENAIMYSPRGSSLKYTITRKGNELVFSLTDQGVGIPADELPYIFSRFFRGAQAKRMDTEGVGIGLYMAKEIVERNNGRLWVESSGEGKGSTFFISFKVA